MSKFNFNIDIEENNEYLSKSSINANSQFKSYKDSAALLAWASPLAPSSNYMIMIPKDLDKYETEFMIELIKILYKNDD